MHPTMRKVTTSRWWMPLFSLGLGAVILAAFLIGGNAEDGLLAFGLMAVLAAVIAVGSSRSETLRGLSGPGRDERWRMIDMRAAWFAGQVLLFALIGSWLYELADGGDGNPYGQFVAIAGVAYILAIGFLRWRGRRPFHGQFASPQLQFPA